MLRGMGLNHLAKNEKENWRKRVWAFEHAKIRVPALGQVTVILGVRRPLDGNLRL